MASCPRCSAVLPWKRVLKLFFSGNASIVCASCSAKLGLDKEKMKLFYLSFVGIAAVLGTMAALARASGYSALLLLAVCLGIGALIFVRVARLREARP